VNGQTSSDPPRETAAAARPTAAAELLAAGLKHHHCSAGEAPPLGRRIDRPSHKAEWTGSGLFSNLGVALKDQGKPDEAIAAYRQALRLKPDLVAEGCLRRSGSLACAAIARSLAAI
jgi:tetratricopeptide (TPR) repeat protein